MTTKHTPGPWTFTTPESGTPDITILTHIQATGPHASKGQTNPLYIARAYGTGEHTGPINQEKLANARLIASAPELLDLAKDALAQLEKMDFSCSANWNGSIKTNVALLLSAAIGKAEGRE